MGGLCSKKSRGICRNPSVVSNSPIERHFLKDSSGQNRDECLGLLKPPVVVRIGNGTEEMKDKEGTASPNAKIVPDKVDDMKEPCLPVEQSCKSNTKPAAFQQPATAKVTEWSSIARGKAVAVLGMFGSTITNLSQSSGFVPGVTSESISILAFEMANTIVKGYNLLESLSLINIKYLKEVVLPSEGVQLLISSDMDELMSMVAADKREELNSFSREVIRFGNRCRGPEWHNLGRFFEKLGTDRTPEKISRKEAEMIMQRLMAMVQQTAELYHELRARDKLEQDYQRTSKENDPKTLDGLKLEVKRRRKIVEGLKRNSLWSAILDEVVESLVDIVHFLQLEIQETFGTSGADCVKPVDEPASSPQRLGSSGLALHYANVIVQVDTIAMADGSNETWPVPWELLASRTNSIPKSTREMLYQALPPSVKSSLRSKLQAFHVNEEFSVAEIRAELDKTLSWLLPIASNTTKAHHGFGWVGEWANIGSSINRNPFGQTDLVRIQTLYHAVKEKTESYILNIVVWLHHLIEHTRSANEGSRSPIKSPVRSPCRTPPTISLSDKPTISLPLLGNEDHEILQDVDFETMPPGVSKSQELDRVTMKFDININRYSRCHSYSSANEPEKELFRTKSASVILQISFDDDWNKALDVIDSLESKNL